jgi:hypothetical protein
VRTKSALALSFAIAVGLLIVVLGLQQTSGSERRETRGTHSLANPIDAQGSAAGEIRGVRKPEDDSTSLSSYPGAAEGEALGKLLRSAPPGTPAEYPLTLLAAGQNCADATLNDLVLDVCGVDLFPRPPYRASWVLGESDSKWLQELQSLYRSALRNALEAVGGAEDLDAGAAAEIESRVRTPYRDALWALAQARLSSSPNLLSRFEDPRTLGELRMPPSGARDAQYEWLSAVLPALTPLQVLEVGLNTRDDIRYLSATDLPELVQMQLDVGLAYERSSQRQSITREQSIGIHRPFAERLQAIINAKRGPTDDHGG